MEVYFALGERAVYDGFGLERLGAGASVKVAESRLAYLLTTEAFAFEPGVGTRCPRRSRSRMYAIVGSPARSEARKIGALKALLRRRCGQ